MAAAAPEPRTRKSLTLAEKIAAIKEVEKRMKKKHEIAEDFGISPTTLSTYLKHKERILGSECSKARKRMRGPVNPDIDECVIRWLEQARACKIPLRGKHLRAKAEEFASQLGKHNFKASNGWLAKFQERNGIFLKSNTNDAAKSSAAGPSKRVAEDVEAGKSGKIIGKRPKKKLKTIEDEETEGCAPEECMQDPLEMIDVEEPTIKEEVYGNEEFGEMNHGDVLESEAQGKRHFETIYCTPIIKEEMADDIEAPSSCHATDTDIIVPDFMKTVIKTEHVEVDEDEEDDNEELRKPRGNLPLMWRCPLVSCPEMFSAELDMYQHLNLSHVVKGLELLSKSKKASGPRSTVTQDLPNKPTEIPPSTSPAVAISGASGLMFFTSASPPSVPPVTVSSVTTPVVTSHVSTVTTPVVTSHSVPSSSSGPVTVTTTFSYSSITPSSASLVTTMSSSSVSSVTSATIIIAATPSVQAISSSTSSPLASSTELVSTSTQDCSVAPNIVATNHSSPQPPSQVSPLSASGGLKKFIVAPVSDQTSISTGPKQFLLLPSHPQQPQQNTASKPSEPLHIFQPSDLTTEDLPPCATDESEMFSISLARFPLNRRVPIKRKLIEVVDCIKKKNVSPDKLFIAYCENPDSRSV